MSVCCLFVSQHVCFVGKKCCCWIFLLSMSQNVLLAVSVLEKDCCHTLKIRRKQDSTCVLIDFLSQNKKMVSFTTH